MYTMESAPLDGRWVWAYGIMLTMCGEPNGDEEPDWYRVRWEAQTTGDDGAFAAGYWDVGLEDRWMREGQAWMEVPPKPIKAKLLEGPSFSAERNKTHKANNHRL